MPFLTKNKTFCILEVHLHNNTFWEPKNANFGKQVSEYTFLKTIPLLSLCKLQKCEFVKTVTSCAHVTSSVYKYVCRHVVFLYKVTSPTTGLACIIQHFLLFSWLCEWDHFVVVSSVCETCQKLTFPTFQFLVQSLLCKCTL